MKAGAQSIKLKRASRPVTLKSLAGLSAAVFWPARFFFRLDDVVHRRTVADVSTDAIERDGRLYLHR